MTKKLNEAAIVNELTGHSLYFRPPAADQLSPSPRAVAALPIPATPASHTASPAEVPQPDATDVPASASGPGLAQAALDLGDMPYRKFTCLLTPAEHRALDLLKIELSAKLDGTITKENLARCAIHYLVEDCKQHGEQSAILAPLRAKVGGR